MNKRHNRTHRPASLSLLSLNVVLTHASRHVPAEAQTPRQNVDDEQALQLIRLMKLQFKKQAHPVHWMNPLAPFGLLHNETVGPDV